MKIGKFETFRIIEIAKELKIKTKRLSDVIKINTIAYLPYKLYIGSTNGDVIYYNLNENVIVSSFQLPNKKNIDSLIPCLTSQLLIVLSKQQLYILQLANLNIIKSFLNISLYDINCITQNKFPTSNNIFFNQIVIGYKNKLILQIEIGNNEYNILNKHRINEVPLNIQAAKDVLLITTDSSYFIFDLSNQNKIPIFTFSSFNFNPYSTAITENEFALIGPTQGVLCFINLQGAALRAPLVLQEPIHQAIENFPYLIVMTRISIKAYITILNYQVQNIPISTYKNIYFAEKNFICGNKNISELVGPKIQDQLREFLEREDIDILNNTLNIMEERYSMLVQIDDGKKLEYSSNIEICQNIKLEIVYKKILAGLFTDAKTLIVNSRLDILPILKIVDSLQNDDFIVEKDQLLYHQIQLTIQNKQGFSTIFESFLLEVLMVIRDMDNYKNKIIDIDTLLIRLFHKYDYKGLMKFISNQNKSSFKETCNFLKETLSHNALALYYMQRGKHEQAFLLWMDLLENRLYDEHFEGMEIITTSIKTIYDKNLFWKVVKTLFDYEYKSANQIFLSMNFDNEENCLSFPDQVFYLPLKDVLKFLQGYDDSCLNLFLCYLVYDMKNEDPEIHNQLGLLYIKDIQRYYEENHTFDMEKRHHFIKFLEYSKFSDVNMLFNALKNLKLYKERIILLTSLGRYKESLYILSVILKDFKEAENYCVKASKENIELKCELLNYLFELLLQNYYKSDMEKQDIIKFLFHNYLSINSVKILQSLPTEWEIKTIYQLIYVAINGKINELERKTLEKSILVNVENNLYNKSKHLENRSRILNSDTLCHICGKTFDTPNVIEQNNLLLYHDGCYYIE